ncbi:6-phospho-beta-glucosidase [Actinokineospora globicatena]|uniref:6-phospho-beta-glucosidase n=1 Tax=Actinokineospora globicatena TaxID=103729 RepID=UPI0020A28B5A|nr:6-phospho-beta-glucosidase [Actinokineospora globicatena]MCP2306340.1 6-phospho-beta-glucosidase [Actinokineospora globicatena]GLW81767.1 6-phospho-beta-glucosidase [Actinokineospora globicatena]GLW88562.1 6-phospho-beta-glucosidase [Actinokineospora globicatena]
MKLAVVGGGSTYTPELVDGIARLHTELPVTELSLVDPDVNRLELVAGVSARILARAGHPARVTTSTELELGVAGADAVLVQLRVGGQAMRHQDETVPLECGCVGQETVGAGGLAMALRTVPVVLDVAERIASVAPRAWIVDFTNPVGIVTRALLDAGHRAIGLCNVAIGFQRRFAALLDVDPGRVALDHVGLNHLTWVRSVYLRGEDVLPRLLDQHGDVIAKQVGLPEHVLRGLGIVPSYYLRYFYEHDAVVAEQRVSPSRASTVADVEDKLLALYADPTVDTKPDLLTSRGGAFYSEAAVALLASLFGEGGDVHVVNVRNNGTLPFLPDNAVIEVPATVTSAGAQTWPIAPVSPLLAGLIGHVSAYETLAVRAAITGGVDLVTEALLAHPLIGQASVAEKLAQRLVEVNRPHLPWAS